MPEIDPTDLVEHRAFPKSVQPGIPKLGTLPAGWHRLPMGQLLRPVYRPAKMDDETEYQLVTARRNRGGIVARDRLRGGHIATKTQFWTRAGDFLISRRQIAHGACGIVPAELDQSLVSNEYDSLVPTARLHSGFLRHLPHSIYFQQTCFHSSIGVHVEKLIFSLPHWLRWKFDIPSAPEQQRIASVLDNWDQAISTAERLATAQRQRFCGLMQLLITSSDAPRDELVNFARLISDKCNVGDGEFEESIELDNLESGTGRLLGRTVSQKLIGQRVRFREGDTLFAKLRPYLQKSFLADKPGMASTEMWVLRADPQRCTSAYLYYLVRSAVFQAEANRPTGSRMPRADWSWVQEVPLPLPNKIEQGRTVLSLQAAERSERQGLDLVELLRRQKRGLMQKLLTGEWRVPDSIDALLPGSPATEQLAEAAE